MADAFTRAVADVIRSAITNRAMRAAMTNLGLAPVYPAWVSAEQITLIEDEWRAAA